MNIWISKDYFLSQRETIEDIKERDCFFFFFFLFSAIKIFYKDMYIKYHAIERERG